MNSKTKGCTLHFLFNFFTFFFLEFLKKYWVGFKKHKTQKLDFKIEVI